MIKVIAEVGSVHDGSFGNAIKLIDLSKKCGANIVKFQFHLAKHETTKYAPSPKYFQTENRYDYFNRTSFSTTQIYQLLERAKKNKIEFMASVFSIEALKIFDKFNIKYIKIPSGEVTNLPLLNKISKTKMKIFLSTGMSSTIEIENALNVLKGNKVCLMQCTSLYPCDVKKSGVHLLNEFKKYSNVLGFSDHTLTPTAAICSVQYGAKYIEKHITFSKQMYGSDAPFAMEPNEFSNYVKLIKESEIILKNKKMSKDDFLPDVKKMKKIFEKSIVAKKNLKRGSIIKKANLTFKKPGTGIGPEKVNDFIGKKLSKNIYKDQLFSYKHIGYSK